MERDEGRRKAVAQKSFNLEQELSKYRRPQVLIIDELGVRRLLLEYILE